MGGTGWRQANLRAGKWARASVTRLCDFKQSASAMLNHMASAYHRKAVAKWQAAQGVDNTAFQTASPPMTASSDAILPKGAQAGLTAVPVVVDEPEDIESTALLKGRVPQLQDWVDAWASASSTMSYRKEFKLRQKKSEARIGDGVRKRMRKMVRVIAEVVRQKHRQALTAATSISLAADSRGKYKVLRCRCDSASRPYVVDGLLGVFLCGYESLQDAESDHGDRMQRNLQKCISRFWTPMAGPGRFYLQEQDMLANVRSLASDGGASERKLMFKLVRSICPNVVLVVRDFAHAARVAVQRPQHFDVEFNAVQANLFNNGASKKSHAVIPGIQYSDKLAIPQPQLA